MTSETDNLSMDGNDNAHPQTALDHPDNLNFSEPDDELDNQEAQGEGTDDEREPDEITEDDQESDGSDVVDETDTETEGVEAEVKDDVVVTVNGEKVALSDLKAGYMRQSDYSRKTQELGNKRRDLDALSARVTHSVSAVAEFLAQQIPDAPDTTLAMTDPNRFVREKAMHEAAMAKVNSLLTQAGDVKGIANQLTKEQHSELLAQENAKLAEVLPMTATPEGRKKFFDNASSTAKELGYSDQEIAAVADHRMFRLAHYARLGMEAEKAKAKAATKVANAPPVTPTRRPQGQNPSQAKANQDAMKRLNRTGSIHDAIHIDFE